MKQLIIGMALLMLATTIQAQKKTTGKEKPPTQKEMDKMLEAAMKQEGFSKEEQAEMKKMMGSVMPAMMESNTKTANYSEFTKNASLVPARNTGKIANALSKKMPQSEIKTFADLLYSKIIAKGDAAEMAIAKKVITQTPKAVDINAAAILAMVQGHSETALALAIKAVQLEPTNTNYQNNMAALLTQYGYPEQAIPVLRKLNLELPGNSTVLNNLAHAWLSLGEKDSAAVYANAAMRINPLHTEAAQVAGLIKEVKGNDPSDDYRQAMANAPNPFTQQMLKNKGGSAKLQWDDIRNNLTIYEYFPFKWLKLPQLSNTVKGYENDRAIQKAYTRVKDKIEEQISLMTEQTEKEMDALVDKGDAAFVAEMANATMKGQSWMSKPAANVLEVLQAYQTQNQLSFADTIKKLEKWKDELRKEKDIKIRNIYKKIDDRNQTSCQQYKAQLDALENEYLSEVNTRTYKTMFRHISNYQSWLNAWVTWNWYVTGNVKNLVMMQDLQATQHLVALYDQMAQLLEALPEHCGVATKATQYNLPVPAIPNFTCPAVVSIPGGAEWQQLTTGAKDFNKNVYGIIKSAAPVPNVSVAYGIGNQIAQPGRAPFLKTANGSILPGGINSDDDELAPIPNLLPKGEELAAIPDVMRELVAKDLMQAMLSADCKNIKSDKENFKELIERLEKHGRLLRIPKIMESLSGYLRKVRQAEIDATARKTYEVIIKDEVRQKGLQPTISNGLQPPGTFTLKQFF